MLGNAFQQMYTIVDASVIERGIGLQALAALGSADWFNWLFFSIALGFAQGFSIPVAQAFGAKDFDDCAGKPAMRLFWAADGGRNHPDRIACRLFCSALDENAR